MYDGHSLDKDGSEPAELNGAFEISGCKGKEQKILIAPLRLSLERKKLRPARKPHL
jgi:hypothetical protein